jgi:hypothetical protein
MSQESSLWPAKGSLHCTFIVSRAEHFLGKPLRGASLLGLTSMTFGFFLALFLFLVELLVFGFTGGSDEGDFALFDAGKSGAIHWIIGALAFSGLALLYHWLDIFSSKWGSKKQIVSALIFVSVMLTGLAISLVTDCYSKEESFLKPSDCHYDACTGEVSNTQITLDSSFSQNQIDKTLEGADFSKLGAEELDYYFREHNFSDVSAVATINLIKERFAGISLFKQERVHDWAQYLEELEALSYTNKFAVPTKIYTALKNKAPFEIVEQIVLNGHELDGIDISALAMYLNVQQLQKLENYGVDLTLSTSASGSAIVNSLLHKGGSSVFEYLISKEELVSSTEFDVLKEVLVMSYDLKRPPIYAKKLIERGAVVSEETKAWVENELKTKDPRYYSLVKVHLNI